MFYDWIINIEKDISLVWRYERLSLPKTLYIATRYLWFVFVVLDFVVTPPNPIAKHVCFPDSVEFSRILTAHISRTLAWHLAVSTLHVVCEVHLPNLTPEQM